MFSTEFAGAAGFAGGGADDGGAGGVCAGDLPQATNYFYALASDSNCPAPVRMSAYFALGDALKSWATQPTTPVPAGDPDLRGHRDEHGDAVALAWGRLGDCYQQLLALGDTNSFAPATNAYQNVIDATNAGLRDAFGGGVRAGAGAGKGGAAETGERPGTGGLVAAGGDHYLNVAYGSNRRGDEAQSDPWVEQAGLQAATVEGEDLKEWDKAINI